MLKVIEGGAGDADPSNSDGFVSWEYREQMGEMVWQTVGTRVPQNAIDTTFDRFYAEFEEKLKPFPGYCFTAVSMLSNQEIVIYARLPTHIPRKQFDELVVKFTRCLQKHRIVCRPMGCPIPAKESEPA